MNYSINENQSGSVLAITGELDANTAPSLRPALDSLVGSGDGAIVIDASDLELIDSSGVGAIVSLYKRARATGRPVRFVGLGKQPLALFRLLRLDTVFALA